MTRPLARLWRGEVPLSEAFWTWAVLGGLLVNLVTSGLFMMLLTRDLPVLALLAGYGPSVPYNVLALVGVWRAAGRHTGDEAWANTARVLALVGLLALTLT